MAATQHDVAQLVGVSQRTVSRCFIQPAAVHPETLKQVLDVAGRIGYRPNGAARTIRSGRSECVVLLRDAGTANSHVPSALLWGVHQRLQEHRLHLKLGDFPAGTVDSHAAYNQPMSDGLLVPCHHAMSEAAEAHVRGGAIPAVWINTMGTADCVFPDDIQAGREATERLIGLGHRRIVFLDRPQGDGSFGGRYCNCRERSAGYERAMTSAGLVPRLIRCGAGEAMEAAMNVCRHILAAPERPTAIVICRKQEAEAVVYAAHAFHGVVIPRDLSVVTFSDDRLGAFPRISAFVVPWHAMGLMAVDLLIHKITDQSRNLTPRRLPMEWFAGTTAAPPPRGANGIECAATVG